MENNESTTGSLINADQFKSDTQKISASLKNMAVQADFANSKLNLLGNNLKVVQKLSDSFRVDGLKDFVKDAIRVNEQLQEIENLIKNIVEEKGKADNAGSANAGAAGGVGSQQSQLMGLLGTLKEVTSSVKTVEDSYKILASLIELIKGAGKGGGGKATAYAAIAVAILSATAAMIDYTVANTAAARAEREFNKEQATFNAQQDEKKKNIIGLIKVIQDETTTAASKIEAYNKLKKLSPELTKIYDQESLATVKLSKAQRDLNKIIGQETYENALKKRNELQKEYDKVSQQGKQMNPLAALYFKIGGIDEEKIIEKKLEEINIKKEAYEEVIEINKPVEIRIQEAKQAKDGCQFLFNKAQKEYEDAKKKFATEDKIPVWIRIFYNVSKEGLENATALIGKLESHADSTYTELVSNAVKDIKTAQQELKNLTKPGVKTNTDDVTAARTKVNDTLSQYRNLTGKEYGAGAKELAQRNKERERKEVELKERILQINEELEAERLLIIKDGKEKRLDELEVEYNRKKRMLDREYHSTLDKYKEINQQVPEEVHNTYNERSAINEKVWETGKETVDKDYNKEYAEQEKQLTIYLISEEEKRKAAIKERYDQQRIWAKQQFDQGYMSEQQYTDFNIKVDNAEAGEELHTLLDKYKTFTEKRIEIETQYNSQIAELRNKNAEGQYDGNIQEAEKMRDKELEAIDAEIAGREATFVVWTEKIASMGLVQLQSALTIAKNTLEENNPQMSDKEKAVLRAKIATLKGKVEVGEAKNASKTSSEKSDEKWKDTLSIMKETSSTISDISSSFNGLDEATKSALTTASNVANGTITIITSIQTLGKKAGEEIKAVEKASVILAIIGTAVKALTSIFGAASQADKRHQEALKEIAASKIKQQREYNLLLLQQKLLMKEATTIFGEQQIAKAVRATEVYKDAIGQYQKNLKGEKPRLNISSFNVKASLKAYGKEIDDYNKGIGALNRISVKTGHKKTGLFGWGKGKDIYTSVLDVYGVGENGIVDEAGRLNVEMAKTIINTGQMSDENKALLQDLINLQETADKAQEGLRSYLEETFGGLGDGMMTALTDAIQNGTDAWENFGKAGSAVLENLGKQLTYSLFFAGKFEKLQKDLEGVYSSGKTEDEIANDAMNLVGDFYNGIGEDMQKAQVFMEGWKDKAAEQGFTVWENDKAEENTTASKGFTAMSQDTATELNGRFTSLQMSGINLEQSALQRNEALNVISFESTTIRTQVGLIGMNLDEIKDINRISMNHLYKIEKNTALLANTNDLLHKVVANTSNL